MRLGIGIVVLGAACIYPTDRSVELRVVVDSIPDAVQGEVFPLSATVVDADGMPLPNAEVVFASADPLVAIVGEDGTLLAVDPGTTEVVATARDFEDAEPGSRSIRVRDLIEIDSITPSIVRFGDTLRVYGVGLNPERLLLADLGGRAVTVRGWVPDDLAAPNRFGVLTAWVPAFASFRSRFTALSVDGLAISPDTSVVFQLDIYEPNDTTPWDFGPLERNVANPSLAFEFRARDDSIRTEWYRFTQTVSADRTVIIRSDEVGPETYQVFFTDSLAWNGVAQEFELGPRASTIGPSLYLCRGIPFAPPQVGVDSVVIALRDLRPGSYDVLAAYVRQGAYSLRILDGYRSALAPDAAEENDFCTNAGPIGFNDAREYTIDNPGDIDWYRLQVDQAAVGVRFDVDATEALADLDLYVLRDFLPDSLPLVGFSNIGGATDEVTSSLTAGSYFLVVVDFAGVPTAYTLNAQAGVATPAPAADRAVFKPGDVATPWLFFKKEGAGR